MNGGQPVEQTCFAVLGGWIALVLCKVVIRPLGMALDHISVPLVLGKNACSHDLGNQGIPADNRLGDAIEIRPLVAVDKGQVHLYFSADFLIGALHGQKRSLQDVDPVYFLGCCQADGPKEGFLLNHLFCFKTLLFTQLL